MKSGRSQDQSQLKWIADFIWDIADERLRDVYGRGNYRDGILSMGPIPAQALGSRRTRRSMLLNRGAIDADNR